MPLVGNETTRIPLTTPGEWVDVKARLSRGDFTEIQKALVRSRSVEGGGLNFEGGDPAEMIEAAEFRILELAIVSWSFEEPVTRENIRRLSVEDYDLVRSRLNELAGRRTDDERGNSRGSGQTPSSTAQASLPNSDGSR